MSHHDQGGNQNHLADGRPQQPRSPEVNYNQELDFGNSAGSPGITLGQASTPPMNNGSSLPSWGTSDYDYQQSNISLLKAQLKVVTHERDMLKKDVKRMERDKHLYASSVLESANGIFHQPYYHLRTGSDTASGSSGKQAHISTLSRSHSIASSADKSILLSTVSPPPASASPLSAAGLRHLQPQSPQNTSAHSAQNPGSPETQERLILELQYFKKQHGEALKKYDQTMKELEYFHGESEALRSRYSDLASEKQRVDQENSSLRIYMEEERKELAELRRQQQEVLNSDGGNSEPLSIMYSTLLRNYESIKEEYNHVRSRCEEIASSHAATAANLEHSEEEILRFKKLYQEMLTERNQFKQQCTQAIRQWDQALRERNDLREALTKVQRQFDEATKEVNQAMTVRIKASKDIKRLTDERNAAMQEYSLIMSERDSVHKEIEKLQDEVQDSKKKVIIADSRAKHFDEEKKKFVLQVEMLKREIEDCLQERDKAMKESHDLREKFGGGKSLSDLDHFKYTNKNRLEIDRHKKDRNSGSSETIDTTGSNLNLEVGIKERLDNLDQANNEIDRLRKIIEKVMGELQDAGMEADVAKGRRDWAFAERDKVVLERESIRTLCDKLRRERDRAVSELAEALRDSDEGKKLRNETLKENKELREKLEAMEKEIRMKFMQRSPGHSQSNDSAIDTDLYEWDTETLDLDMQGLGSQEDLGIDLAGGRDDPHCPGDKPIYISSIGKGSFLDGKLRINDCILRVNNVDCRDVDREAVLHTLKNSNSTVSLMVKRRKPGKRYQATLHLGHSSSVLSLGRNLDHGLTLELGVYIAKIQPGSVAAKEGGIAVGDRVININEYSLDHLGSLSDAVKFLNVSSATSNLLTLTLAKSHNTLTRFGSVAGPLSSSSSGHNMEKVDEESHKVFSPKLLSAATSPIKDTIRGSQEMIKKLMSNSSGSKDRYSGIASSSSSEKVYNKSGSKESKGPFGLIESVREKIDTVRGRRRTSKEPSDRPDQLDSRENVSSSRDLSINTEDIEARNVSSSFAPLQKGNEELVLEELDSVLNSASYHSSSSGSKSNSSGKKKRSKDGHKSGGTWPRARCGPIIEQGTGTILHPQKVKKERLPLAELLYNLPKYPHENTSSRSGTLKGDHVGSSVIQRNNGGSSERKSRPLTAYDYLPEHFKMIPVNESSIIKISRHQEVNPADLKSSRDTNLILDPVGHESNPSSARKLIMPSDTSIDESVKSAHPDVLEKYLKRSTKPSSANLHHQLYGASYNSSKQLYGNSSTNAMPHLIRPSGFSPYYMPPPPPPQTSSAHHLLVLQQQVALSHQVGGHNLATSSPRYSSPPPLSSQQNDTLLGSPIPDYRGYSHKYELSGSQISSVSPTSELFHHALHHPGGSSHSHHHHSPSPGDSVLESYSKHRSGHNLPPPPSLQAYHSTYGPYPNSGSYFAGSQTYQSYHQNHRQCEESSPPPHYTDYARRYGKENDAIQTRIRIPSNTSVATSHGSVSTLSKCGSPLPSFSVQYQKPDGLYEYQRIPRKPSPGDIRQIFIEKSSEQLGIKIEEGAKKGVFVSSVSENSLASQVGLQVGDQLLEVCGVNLRGCGKDQAVLVLQQVGNSISMKVQFNPLEFHSMQSLVSANTGTIKINLGGSSRSSSEHQHRSNDEDDDDSSEDSNSDEEGFANSHRRSLKVHGTHHPISTNNSAPSSAKVTGLNSRSESPTPKNSPQNNRHQSHLHDEPQSQSSTLRSALNPSLPPSAHSTLTRLQISQMVSTLQSQPPVIRSNNSQAYEPRLVFPQMKKTGDLGVRLVGGNAVGIFIHSVEIDSAAFQVGLRSADQILEYNGVDLRQATAEQAAYELAKPAEKVSLLVQYNLEKYESIKDQPGDSYYVRAMFDRLPETSDTTQLTFQKDDILYIDNTMYNGEPGHWSAWLLDNNGVKSRWGVIPSKYQVEVELLMKRSLGSDSDCTDGSRRSWASTRRSFFKRRKGGRSSSRDPNSNGSKELASYSDVASLASYPDAASLHDENPINSYLRVEMLDYLVTRPVLIIGPLADAVVDKLTLDYPLKFARCEPELLSLNQETIEQRLRDNSLIDFKRKGPNYECITIDSIRKVCDRNQHCILSIHLENIERLHQHQIYPIVLLIKFKSVKQIKEVKDPRCLGDKMSQKDAKNIFEHAQKLESEYAHMLSDTIHAGANLMLMCAQIATRIEQEQNKKLWVTMGSIW